MKLTEITEKEYADISSNTISKLAYSSSVESIVKAFTCALNSPQRPFGEYHLIKKDADTAILSYTKGIYTKEDITQFSTELESHSSIDWKNMYRGTEIGIFLTELISIHYKKNKWNRLKEDILSCIEKKDDKKKNNRYTLILQKNGLDISSLGFELNGAEIFIIGDIGTRCGHSMTKGKITVSGNTGSYLGYHLYGGEIIVEGDASEHVGEKMCAGTIHVLGNANQNIGEYMFGGKIIVKGNCGRSVGYCMNNGEIHIFGNADGHVGSQMLNGKITIEGTCGPSVGELMKRGVIHIKNNSGQECADPNNREARVIVNGEEFRTTREEYK